MTGEPGDDRPYPSPGQGRRLEVPVDFAGDDGAPDPRLRSALERYALDASARSEVLAALSTARLLVPVVAVLEEVDASGADKSSHMATVSLVQADGRRGLLAFTGVDALARWDPQARPVPAWSAQVAAAAVAEGAHGVLLDIAGPVRFALDGEALTALSLSAPDR